MNKKNHRIMFEQELLKLKIQGILRQVKTVETLSGARVRVQDREAVLFCSNDYLGLASHPALQEAASRALANHAFGSGASRLVSGTSGLHRELEEKIARFKGTEAAILFNSGYAANTGVIPALVQPGDVILSDSLNHASIIDGCRLSRAEVQVYRHSDMNHVEILLRKCTGSRRILIVTDGVFSMDGDLARLPELSDVADRYGALLMVDDAHGCGVLGRTGKGTIEHFGLAERVPIQMGTFGKAFGSFGAYVAGSRDLIDYLVNRARSFIFSTALPPSVCAASIAALDLVDRLPELRQRLWNNRERFAAGLAAAGISIGPSESPIIPVMTGSADRAVLASEKLFERGIFATAIRPPTVPPGSARIRATVTASHTGQDIDRATAAFAAVRQEGYLSE